MLNEEENKNNFKERLKVWNKGLHHCLQNILHNFLVYVYMDYVLLSHNYITLEEITSNHI